MIISPDYLVERKNNRQSIKKLKMLVIVLACAIMILLSIHSISKDFLSNTDYIASIIIDETIGDDYERDERILALKDDKRIKALILNINSPGGNAAASEAIYNALLSIKNAGKPIVCIMHSYAASGGYMIALPADYILAQNTTITGSIGVLSISPDVTNLAEKVGVAFNVLKSSEFKATPNPFEKLTADGYTAAMGGLMDVYDYFVQIVVENRHMPREAVLQLADGRVYTGRQAKSLGLVDAIGSTEEAKLWLQANKDIDSNLKIVEVSLKPDQNFIEGILDKLAHKTMMGIKTLFTQMHLLQM